MAAFISTPHDKDHSRSRGKPATPPMQATVGADMAQNMLLQLYQTVPRLEEKLNGIMETVDSTKAKVDDLATWKSRILGGVAVLAFIWAAFWLLSRCLSDYVHVSFGTTTEASAPSLQR